MNCVNLKYIKQSSQSGSLEQRMTLVKINSCEGFIVSLKHNDIIRSFGALIQIKIEKHLGDEKKFKWPYKSEELMMQFIIWSRVI